MRALVTGGAGFIGRHLVKALVARGDGVVVLDNFRRSSREDVPDGVTLVEGDIRDPETVAKAAAGCDTVFHLAAQSNVLGAVQDVEYSFSTNVTGTFHVLKAASDAGVRSLVFASSREVYGDQRVVPVAESACILPRNPYGASKAAAEAYCRAWPSLAQIDCSILRFANVYGPGDRDRVIPLWLERAARREPITVFGGQQVLDFVHVDVAVEALVRAAGGGLPGPVNVGSGKGTPILALAERIGALAGRRVPIELEPARAPEVSRFVADVTRMRSVLGIEPPADPLGGLAAMWRGLAVEPASSASAPAASHAHPGRGNTKRGAGPKRRVFAEEANG